MFSLEHLNQLRAAEIERVARLLPAGVRILEIGAGTGRQTLALRELGFDVEPIDLPDSNYAQDRLTAITEYDGRHIPFPDTAFDVVYSASVLEHVADLAQLHAEIRRVLAPGGRCIHVLPTHAWRLWTTLSGVGAAVNQTAGSMARLDLAATRRASRALRGALLPARHGERGNAWSELWSFRPDAWRRHFRAHQFEVVHDEPMELFYTGHLVLGDRLSLAQRAWLSAWIGSACHLFELRPAVAF